MELITKANLWTSLVFTIQVGLFLRNSAFLVISLNVHVVLVDSQITKYHFLTNK